MWPQKESQSQEQSQDICLWSRLPPAPTPTGTALLSSSLPDQGPSGWRARTLTTGVAGPWQLGVWAHSSWVCVWILGPVVKDSQRHQE